MSTKKIGYKRLNGFLAILLVCAMVLSPMVQPENAKAASFTGTVTTLDVVSTLPKYIQKSRLSSMPAAIDVSVNGGSTVNTPVTWSVSSGNIGMIGDTVTLTGTLPDYNNYQFTTDVVAYSTNLIYFVDCGTVKQGVTPIVYNDIKSMGVSLRNTVSDQDYTTGSWGLSTTSASAKGKVTALEGNYLTELNATGYYASTITYSFDNIEAGSYILTTGHYEWWMSNNHDRPCSVSVNGTTIGDANVGPFAGQKDGVIGQFDMAADGTATVTITKTGTDNAAISYLAIEKIQAASGIDTTAWDTKLAEAEAKVSSEIYSVETEAALVDAINAGKGLIAVVATDQDVTDAVALVQLAMDGLQLADKSKLVQYVEEPMDTGLYDNNAAFVDYKNLLSSTAIVDVYNNATPTRTEITNAINSLETARAGLAKLYTELLVDGNDIDKDNHGNVVNTFKGFGAVSCNNTSNLLLDYKDEHPDEYWKMMDMLFNPDTGAGISHVKVELGGDVNSSSGTEPATMRHENEVANVLRGAGWHFAADAKSINPNITVEALRWGEPAWTKAGGYEARYKWYKETIDAVYDVYGMKLDYLSPGQNENNGSHGKASVIADNLAWIKYCAQKLNAETTGRYDYSTIKIVATDSHSGSSEIAGAMLADSELMDLVDVIGDHYTIKGNAALTTLNEEYGKEVWYSEGIAPMINASDRINEQPNYGGVGGSVGIVDLATRYISAYNYATSSTGYPAKMTRWEFQPAIAGFYQGSAYSPKQLIGAFYPWSGYYEADGGLQMVEHFTRFAEIGWNYIEGACYGDGSYTDGGVLPDTGTNHYLTLTDPSTDDYSIIFANNTGTERKYQVKVTNLTTITNDVNVWETRGPDNGEAYDANWMQNIEKLTPTVSTDNNGVSYYNITVKPYSIVTVTTQLSKGTNYVSGQNASIKSNDVLALPYTDDFEYDNYPVDADGRSYLERRGNTPRYTSDQRGAFEITTDKDNPNNNVLYQVISQDIIPSEWDVWGSGVGGTTSVTPNTWIGDQRWANYKATVDFKLDTSGTTNNFAAIGIRQNESLGGSDSSAYSARIFYDGTYILTDNNSAALTGTIANFDPTTWHTLSVEGKENVITAYLDGVEFVTYTDTSSPNLAGRISILSGYYNTYYDNLTVSPIEGYAAYSEKVDDSSKDIVYSATGWSFAQSGYAHYNRTLKNGGEGGIIPFTEKATTPGTLNKIYYYRNDGQPWGSNTANTWASPATAAYCELTFEGTGIDFYNEKQGSAATANIYIDGTLHGVANLNTNTMYSISGLPYGQHTIKVEAASGFTSVVKFKIQDSPMTTSFTYPFIGTGFNLFGKTAASTVDIYVDGTLVEDNFAIKATNDRDVSYWLRGLDYASHTLKVVVESGTFTLDGIDVMGEVAVPKTISSIVIKNLPNKTQYSIGQALDVTGLVVTANASDGTSYDVADLSELIISGYDANILGDQEITVTYKGQTAKFVINVKELLPLFIEVKQNPYKVNYVTGQALDLSGLVITAHMDDGSSVDITNLGDLVVTGFDANTVGEQVITVTYKGQSVSFKIMITGINPNATITSIDLKNIPVKVRYASGQALELTGLAITVNMSDGSFYDVTDLNQLQVTGYDAYTLGDQELTVMYQGFTVTYFVEVVEEIVPDPVDPNLVLDSIVLSHEPNKLNYTVGEELNLSGLSITAIYSDNSQVEINDISQLIIIGYNASVAGEQTITVLYQGKTAEFTIYVKEKEIPTDNSDDDEDNSDQSEDTTETKPVDNSKVETVIAVPSDKGNTESIPVSITTKVKNTTAVVTVEVSMDTIQKALEGKDTTKEPVSISIPLASSDTLVEQLKSEKVKSASVQITVDQSILKDSDKAVISEIQAKKEILEAVKENNKSLSVDVADEEGKIWYSWKFNSKQMNLSKDKVEDLNLAVNLVNTNTDAKIDQLIEQGKKNTSGYILSMDSDGSLPSGTVLKVNVVDKLGYKSGESIYIYHYNEELNTFDSIPRAKYVVGKDGFVSINVKYGDKYVILDESLAYQDYRSLKEQVTVSSSTLSLTKGKSKYMGLNLTEVVGKVSSFKTSATQIYGAEVAPVKITYTTSNKSVAVVSKNGKITAKKSGKVTITAIVKFSNGSKTVLKKTVIVK